MNFSHLIETSKMPPASSNAGGSRGSGDEILGAAGDEIKVFKDEGENEEEQGASESLHADLLGEAETKGLWRHPHPSYSLPAFHQQALSMGYLMNPYGALAAAGGLPPFLPIGSPPLQVCFCCMALVLAIFRILSSLSMCTSGSTSFK